jgi:hypothetical protein
MNALEMRNKVLQVLRRHYGYELMITEGIAQEIFEIFPRQPDNLEGTVIPVAPLMKLIINQALPASEICHGHE